jgi:hypothetical protein
MHLKAVIKFSFLNWLMQAVVQLHFISELGSKRTSSCPTLFICLSNWRITTHCSLSCWAQTFYTCWLSSTCYPLKLKFSFNYNSDFTNHLLKNLCLYTVTCWLQTIKWEMRGILVESFNSGSLSVLQMATRLLIPQGTEKYICKHPCICIMLSTMVQGDFFLWRKTPIYC